MKENDIRIFTGIHGEEFYGRVFMLKRSKKYSDCNKCFFYSKRGCPKKRNNLCSMYALSYYIVDVTEQL